jgi:hypothetical protein
MNELALFACATLTCGLIPLGTHAMVSAWQLADWVEPGDSSHPPTSPNVT